MFGCWVNISFFINNINVLVDLERIIMKIVGFKRRKLILVIECNWFVELVDYEVGFLFEVISKY